MRRLETLYILALTFAWPITTYAAGVTLSKSLAGITFWDWFVVMLLSMVSSGVSLLGRMKEEHKAYLDALRLVADGERPPSRPNWWLHGTFNFGGGVLAGTLMFFACESANLEDFREALLIGLAGWVGGRALDSATDAVVAGIKNFVSGGAKTL